MSYRPQYYDSNIYMQSTNLILKAADLYYNQGMRQQEISEQLEISVSTVSRLLKKAKEQEIVRFTIDQKYLEGLTLEEALCRRYGLREVIVAPIPAESTELRLEEKKKIVALEGARYLQRVVSDHDVIGVAYGETVWYVYNYLNPCQRHDSQFVTLHGVLEHETNRLDGSWLVPRIAKAFGGKSYTINCKGLQSSREDVLRSLSEPDVCRVFEQFPKITVSISGVSVSYATVITIIVSAVIMVALYLFTQKARIGCAMRCVSEDKDASTLMGINVNHTILITFAIGAGLAAVAALMYIAQYPKVYTTMGATLGIYAFVAAVLGGIGSLPGAMLGGLLIGIVQSGANTYISSSMSDTFVYLILIVVLMLRPAGILGKNVGEKV